MLDSPSYFQKVIDTEEQSSAASRSKVELQSLSTRNYLDHTVVPILLDAMAVVARERCVCVHVCVCVSVWRRGKLAITHPFKHH